MEFKCFYMEISLINRFVEIICNKVTRNLLQIVVKVINVNYNRNLSHTRIAALWMLQNHPLLWGLSGSEPRIGAFLPESGKLSKHSFSCKVYQLHPVKQKRLQSNIYACLIQFYFFLLIRPAFMKIMRYEVFTHM